MVARWSPKPCDVGSTPTRCANTPWCNGSTSGSGPLGLGSNPGGVALEGSAEWSASGLESRARCKPEGSIPVLSALEDVRRGAHLPCDGRPVDRPVVRLHLLPLDGCWDTEGPVKPLLQAGRVRFPDIQLRSATKVVTPPAKRRSRVRLPGWSLGDWC